MSYYKFLSLKTSLPLSGLFQVLSFKIKNSTLSISSGSRTHTTRIIDSSKNGVANFATVETDTPGIVTAGSISRPGTG
jgi:hypothetical protein